VDPRCPGSVPPKLRACGEDRVRKRGAIVRPRSHFVNRENFPKRVTDSSVTIGIGLRSDRLELFKGLLACATRPDRLARRRTERAALLRIVRLAIGTANAG